jgi:GTP-binding protein
MNNIVAIVGRPNVGKSTVYNRLIGEREAIVDDFSGVTRDRMYGSCEWNGKTFTVVDTGGFVKNSDDVFEVAIRNQVEIAIDEADLIILMVDVTTGITDLDEQMVRMLRRTKKSVILAVNKVDNHARLLDANEFWSLGFEETYFLSSTSGSGSGEVLDAVTAQLTDEEPIKSDIPKFAIIGQPNVGKSSLVNALLGKDRNVVTDIAGTTRDAIHATYKKFGREFTLIDTAGIRKKNKVHENLEFYSVMRAVRALEESDICYLMIDATLGIESQDMSIFNLAVTRNKGVVILVNKWDLIKNKETNTARDFEQKIKEKLAPFSDVPVVFISALEKQRIFKAIDTGIEVFEKRNVRLKTSQLNDLLLPIIEKTPPPSSRGRFIKIKYITMAKTYYPVFIFFCNHPKHVKESYKLFLENQIRSHFDFSGVPLGIFFREK